MKCRATYFRSDRGALLASIIMVAFSSCAGTGDPHPTGRGATHMRDIHSHGRPAEVRVTHIHGIWNVDFDAKQLQGSVTLDLARAPGSTELQLDTRELAIQNVTAGDADREWMLGDAVEFLGAPLTIKLEQGDTRVTVHYHTQPSATGMQWLAPSQTAGKQHPFLFTQSQAIHARSWIPCQDSPGVRVTYSAEITAPSTVDVLMSAEKLASQTPGVHRFRMPQAIPPYLIALAVGELAFREISPRAGVYAEPSVVDGAAHEFQDIEKMMIAVEGLYGPYRWDRYDILVLPPSFPFGGMENPRLTFATPTILAGDRSLVSLVAHELAHSWSGNLVSNATWSDFWLNEGFTVYLERRIQEVVYGTARASMEGFLGRQELDQTLAGFEETPDETVLYIDLAGRDPDDGMTDVPYEKGALLLLRLEQIFGRETFDRFLRQYFDAHAFQSITTDVFVHYLQDHLLANHPDKASQVDVKEWIHGHGLPDDAPAWTSPELDRAESAAHRWLRGEVKSADLRAGEWNTQEWLRYLRALGPDVGAERLAELDGAYALTATGNAEIAMQWLLIAIRNGYQAAYDRLETYLTSQGRRKLVKPLYEALCETREGWLRGEEIYAKARPLYHSITYTTVDEIFAKARARWR